MSFMNIDYKKHMTNADVIRKMSDEELAKYIANEQINAIVMFLKGFDDELLNDFTEVSSIKIGEVVDEKLKWLKKEADK